MPDVLARLIFGLYVGFTHPEPSALEQVKASGVLRVLVPDNTVTYYEGPHGPVGFDLELAQRFADDLGVQVEFLLAEGPTEVLSRLRAGEADIAAAGLAATPVRAARLRPGPGYQQVTEQVVYRHGTAAPKDERGLADCGLAVLAQSSHMEMLGRIRWTNPLLRWSTRQDIDTDDLLEAVAGSEVGCVVVNSNELTLARRFYPELRAAFDIAGPRSLAWMLPHATDDSLYLAVARLFRQLERRGELDEMLERHYGPAARFDYVSARQLHRHADDRLPPLLPHFRSAARRYGLDWRLLAAVAYQESHWDPEAVSPTGVRGIRRRDGCR